MFQQFIIITFLLLTEPSYIYIIIYIIYNLVI